MIPKFLTLPSAKHQESLSCYNEPGCGERETHSKVFLCVFKRFLRRTWTRNQNQNRQKKKTKNKQTKLCDDKNDSHHIITCQNINSGIFYFSLILLGRLFGINKLSEQVFFSCASSLLCLLRRSIVETKDLSGKLIEDNTKNYKDNPCMKADINKSHQCFDHRIERWTDWSDWLTGGRRIEGEKFVNQNDQFSKNASI